MNSLAYKTYSFKDLGEGAKKNAIRLYLQTGKGSYQSRQKLINYLSRSDRRYLVNGIPI